MSDLCIVLIDHEYTPSQAHESSGSNIAEIVLTKCPGFLIKFNTSDRCILAIPQSPAITPRADTKNNRSSAPAAVFTFSSPGMMPPHRPKSAFDVITRPQTIDQINCVSANLSSQSKWKLASEIMVPHQHDLCVTALIAAYCSVCSGCLKTPSQFRQRFSEERTQPIKNALSTRYYLSFRLTYIINLRVS